MILMTNKLGKKKRMRCPLCSESLEVFQFGPETARTKIPRVRAHYLYNCSRAWNLEERNETIELLRTKNNASPVICHNFKLLVLVQDAVDSLPSLDCKKAEPTRISGSTASYCLYIQLTSL